MTMTERRTNAEIVGVGIDMNLRERTGETADGHTRGRAVVRPGETTDRGGTAVSATADLSLQTVPNRLAPTEHIRTEDPGAIKTPRMISVVLHLGKERVGAGRNRLPRLRRCFIRTRAMSRTL